MEQKTIYRVRDKLEALRGQLKNIEQLTQTEAGAFFALSMAEITEKPSTLFPRGLSLSDALEISWQITQDFDNVKTVEEFRLLWSLMNRLETTILPDFRKVRVVSSDPNLYRMK